MKDVKSLNAKYRLMSINKSKVQSLTNFTSLIKDETPKQGNLPILSCQSTTRANSFSKNENQHKLLTIRNNSNARFNIPVKKYLSCDIMTNLGISVKKAKQIDYSDLAKKIKGRYSKETAASTITKDNSLYTAKLPEIEGPEDLHFFNIRVMMNNKRLANKFEPQ
jgi:hypothetical protein